MRILITGGFGFIGGRVAKHLMSTGNQVILGSRKTLAPPAWLPQAAVAQTEWNNALALEQICKDVDVIIHAAGMNAHECSIDPLAALKFNGVSTERLVLAAMRMGVKKFIYLSTAHVYASPLVGTITENTCPSNLHPYATSHLAGENAVLGATQRGGIQGIVLRLSNTFGAPVHKDVNCWMLLVNDLCKQAVETHKLSLQSNGLQQRDFIGLSDVCSVIEYFLMNHVTSRGMSVFNVGAGQSLSVMSMAQLIRQRSIEALGFEPELEIKKSISVNKNLSLEFRTENLNLLGVNLKKLDSATEIDNLLLFCNCKFTQKQRSNF